MIVLLKLLFALVISSYPVWAHHRKDCVTASDLGNYFINYCEEKCVCEQLPSGEFAHVCYREREEFTCMSQTRRVRFLNAYKTISTPGNPQYQQFSKLIGIHQMSNFIAIHSTQYFLPWHRWYILALEDLLRNEDCRITVPWWRWSKKSTNWWTGTPFSSSSTWLGTDGVSPSQCVPNGAFTAPWQPPGDICLKHDFTLSSMPTTLQIINVLNLPSSSFGFFSDSLEGTVHNTPHNRIGAHMSDFNSPKSPAFFLHHGYIDKLWDQWQKKSPAHLNSYDGYPMNHQLIETVGTTPSNVQDHFDLAKSRVIYVNIKSSTSGPGHFQIFPFCLLIVQWPNIFSLSALEAGVQQLLNQGSLNKVPQRPFGVKNIDRLREEFRWWFRGQDRASVQILNAKIEAMFEQMSISDEQLSVPKTEFEDRASNMLGFDLKTVAKAASICPVGSKYDTRRRSCVSDETERRVLQAELRKGRVVGAEVVAIEDLQ